MPVSPPHQLMFINLNAQQGADGSARQDMGQQQPLGKARESGPGDGSVQVISQEGGEVDGKGPGDQQISRSNLRMPQKRPSSAKANPKDDKTDSASAHLCLFRLSRLVRVSGSMR